MNLPTSNNLPINKLVSVFRSTSTTYKFYLFAIIELVEEGHLKLERKFFCKNDATFGIR
jgi:hypothetical protein